MMLPKVELLSRHGMDYLLLDAPDLITKCLKSNTIPKDQIPGYLEGILCQLLVRDLSDVVVIDAGSNLGVFGLGVAQAIANQGGTVHCFEPQRIVFWQLCANALINGLDNVFAHQVALGNHSTWLDLPELELASSQNAGGFCVDPDMRQKLEANALHPNALGKTHTKTPQKTLDEFELFERVGFIKVDVEGLELEVFQGALQTFEANAYPPIVFESWGDKYDWFKPKAIKTQAFLESLGYDIRFITPREILAQHSTHKRYLDIQRQGGQITFELCYR